MLIYKITNTVNGKVYIGKTSNTLEQRWGGHLRGVRKTAMAGLKLYRAIRKYGPEVFTVEALYYAKTEEELSRMETFFIVLHQSHKSENGYNMTMGGEGRTGPLPEITKEKIRNSKLGVSLSELHKAAISEGMKNSDREYLGRFGSDNPFFGKTHTEKTLNRNREATRQRMMSLSPAVRKDRAIKAAQARWGNI